MISPIVLKKWEQTKGFRIFRTPKPCLANVPKIEEHNKVEKTSLEHENNKKKFNL